MKLTERFITHACSYAILILTLLYGFTKLSGHSDTSIAFPSYAIIVIFGFVISASEWILAIEKLPKPARVLLHFAALLITFTFMYVLLMKPNASGIMMSVVFFTLLYFVLFFVIRLIRGAIGVTDAAISKKSANPTKKTAKAPYKSMFSGEDK